MGFWKKLFHRHDWRKIGFREESNDYLRWSVRHYECQACGKRKCVDGRFDHIDAPWID